MKGGRVHTPTRRRLLAAGESVAAAGLLAACGGLLQPGGRASGTTPRKAVTLEYWSRFGPPIQAVEEKNLPLFMEKFAPIRVERTTITGGSTGLIEKITTAFASNTAPDLFTMGSRNVVTYAHPESVVSLDSLPRVRREEQDFFGPPQAVARYRAKLYGMTYFIDSRQPIYRKDLLAGAGLPTDRKQLPKTWEQFRETAKKLARWEGGQLARAGFNVSKSGSDVFNLFMVMVAQQGKGMLNAEGTKVAFDGPEGQRALQLLVDFVHRDRIDAFRRPQALSGVPLLATAIVAGQWINSEVIRTVETAGFRTAELLVADFTPEFGSKPTAASYLGGTWQMLSKTTRDINAAVELLLFLTGPQHLLEVAETTTSVPARKSVGQSPYLQNPLLRPFYEALAYGWSVPQHPRFDEMFNRIVANNTDAVAQKKSVREALADSVGYCNALLAAG